MRAGVRPDDDFFQWKSSIARVAQIVKQEWNGVAFKILDALHVERAIIGVGYDAHLAFVHPPRILDKIDARHEHGYCLKQNPLVENGKVFCFRRKVIVKSFNVRNRGRDNPPDHISLLISIVNDGLADQPRSPSGKLFILDAGNLKQIKAQRESLSLLGIISP